MARKQLFREYQGTNQRKVKKNMASSQKNEIFNGEREIKLSENLECEENAKSILRRVNRFYDIILNNYSFRMYKEEIMLAMCVLSILDKKVNDDILREEIKKAQKKNSLVNKYLLIK